MKYLLLLLAFSMPTLVFSEYRSDLDVPKQSGYGVWVDSSPVCVEIGERVGDFAATLLADSGLARVPTEEMEPEEWFIHFELSCRMVDTDKTVFSSDIKLVKYSLTSHTGRELDRPLYIEIYTRPNGRENYDDLGVSTLGQIELFSRERMGRFIEDLVATINN